MEAPIRVLIVNYKMQCAGIEAFIMNMYRNIDRTKVQFDFLVHYTEPQFYDKEIEALGGRIYRLSIREDNNFIKYFKDLKLFFREHTEYKIVHGHMESFGCFYLRSAKKAKVPVRIAHSHIAQKNSGVKGVLKNFLNKGFKKYATHLFACSNVAGEFVFGNKEEFCIYNNAIDAKRFGYDINKRVQARKELKISDDVFVIGHIGRFNTQKNHTFLIDIMSEINKKDPKAVLLLIGEGDLEEHIKNKVDELGLENNVMFLGVRSDVDRLYQAMDVFVMPSLFEGLPVSGVEAQAAGLKCIFSDTITEQTMLTSNVEFISLDRGTAIWADEILKWYKGYDRRDQINIIERAGYDIKKQAKQLQNFYIESIKDKK